MEQLTNLTFTTSLMYELCYTLFCEKAVFSNTFEITWINVRFIILYFLEENNLFDKWYEYQPIINYLSVLLITLNIQKHIGYDFLTANIFTFFYEKIIRRHPKKKDILFYLNSYVFFNYWILVLFLGTKHLVHETWVDNISNLNIHLIFCTHSLLLLSKNNFSDINLNYNAISTVVPSLLTYISIAYLWKVSTGSNAPLHIFHQHVENPSIDISKQELLKHINHIRSDRSAPVLFKSLGFTGNETFEIKSNTKLYSNVIKYLNHTANSENSENNKNFIFTEKDVWRLLDNEVYQVTKPNIILFDFEAVNKYLEFMCVHDGDTQPEKQFKHFMNKIFKKDYKMFYASTPFNYIKFIPSQNGYTFFHDVLLLTSGLVSCISFPIFIYKIYNIVK